MLPCERSRWQDAEPSILLIQRPWWISTTGNDAPDYAGLDLVGCTDDPQVFALYQEMCRAISADTWHDGPRPTPA